MKFGRNHPTTTIRLALQQKARPHPSRPPASQTPHSVARKVNEMTNLDERLMQEPELNADMSYNLKHLLAEAGYPEDVLQQV